MNASIEFLSAVVMMVAAVSFFWAYKTTSTFVFSPRRRDRRSNFRPQAQDRRKQTGNTAWGLVENWIHRIIWMFVAVTFLIVFVVTFGPWIGLA